MSKYMTNIILYVFSVTIFQTLDYKPELQSYASISWNFDYFFELLFIKSNSILGNFQSFIFNFLKNGNELLLQMLNRKV